MTESLENVMPDYQKSLPSQKSALTGALMVACAGLFWSFSGTFVRLAPHLDAWQFLTYRAAGVGVAFFIYDRLQRRESLIVRSFQLGWPGLLGAALMAGAFISFILAIQNTSVAITLFVYSCAPILAGTMAYFILGERMTLAMIISMVLALAGLGIMVNGQLSGGSLFGYSMALLPALLFSYYAVMQRRYPGRDFSPAVSGFAFIVVIVAVAMMWFKGDDFLPNWFECGAAFTNGLVTMGLGFALYQRGAARVPAAGQLLLAQTETLFGSFWVWLFFNEKISLETLEGGGLILLGVVIMAYAGTSQEGARVGPAQNAKG